MFYTILNDKILKTDKFDKKKNNQIVVFNENNFNLENIELVTNIKYTKLEDYKKYLLGSIIKKDVKIVFYVINENIIFVDNTQFTEDLINKIIKTCGKTDYSIYSFIKDFLEMLVANDLVFLDEIEDKLEVIEKDILKNKIDNIDHTLIHYRKELSKIYRSYSQLIDLAMLLQEKLQFNLLDILITRVEHLKSETMVLKDYTHQLQELYNMEVQNRQNDIMKVLTIVTTIFLPLTLLTSWYGMNFKYMPEIYWRFGYPIFIIIFVLVIVICLIIFKIKKLW